MEEKQHPRERDSPMEENGLRQNENRKLERMVARAKRWDVSDELKKLVLDGAIEALTGKSVSRKLKAGRLVKELDALNLAEEKMHLEAGNGRSESEINDEIQAEIERNAAVDGVAGGGQDAHAAGAEGEEPDVADDPHDSAKGLSGP